MELLQLKYFLLLAKVQHVSKTAEMLNISQPSLSSTMKKLEEELGVPLFIRKGRSIELSEYGRAYREYIEEAFLAMENGRRTIDAMRGESENKLNLGVLSPYIWTEIFSAFQAKCPEVRLNRYSVEGSHFIGNLLDGKIDMYLGAINGIEDLNQSKVEYMTLYDDDMVLLVHKSHPLAGRETIDLSECAGESFINLDIETSLQQFINQLYEQAGFEPKVVMVCDYTIRDQMVAENHGVMITTRLSALKCEFQDDVRYIKITDPPVKRKLGFVWRKNAVFTPAMKNFYECGIEFYNKFQ